MALLGTFEVISMAIRHYDILNFNWAYIRTWLNLISHFSRIAQALQLNPGVNLSYFSFFNIILFLVFTLDVINHIMRKHITILLFSKGFYLLENGCLLQLCPVACERNKLVNKGNNCHFDCLRNTPRVFSYMSFINLILFNTANATFK